MHVGTGKIRACLSFMQGCCSELWHCGAAQGFHPNRPFVHLSLLLLLVLPPLQLQPVQTHWSESVRRARNSPSLYIQTPTTSMWSEVFAQRPCRAGRAPQKLPKILPGVRLLCIALYRV